MYMVFRDAEAISKHRNTEHFQKFIEFKNQDNALISQSSQILKGVSFAM